jgi:hypothetical protein
MNTSVELAEKSTVLEEIEKNTASGSVYNSEHFQKSARRGAEQFYKAWLTSYLENAVEPNEMSVVLLDLTFSNEPEFLTHHVCSSVLRMLEKEPYLHRVLSSYSAEASALFDKIIVTPGQLPRLEQEEEEELATGPPDEYFVEGIHINWKSAFKYHEKLNKLRKKHGIRQI